MAKQVCLNPDFQDKSVFQPLTEFRKRVVVGDFLQRRHHHGAKAKSLLAKGTCKGA